MASPVIRIGVCAMAKKSKSEWMQRMVDKLRSSFQVVIFAESVILDETVDNWPTVNVLIAFYSDGFPLDKAQRYVDLRSPYVLNDIAMQRILLSRVEVYEALKAAFLPTPRYAVVWRDEKRPPTPVEESDDEIQIDGQIFKKPFVEKPVSAEDHRVVIYYPTSAGGGSKRRSQDRKSTYSKESRIRRDASYLYEEFVQTNGIDVKVYAVGREHAYAEARMTPSLTGNAAGKARYPVQLSQREKKMARQIVQIFKQTVCGFDLLRVEGLSYVCDVNGFSFVKASKTYYEDTAKILRGLINRRFARNITDDAPPSLELSTLVPTTTGTDMELRCVLALFRHGDRTPKQKLKLVVEHAKWAELFEKFRRPEKEEAKLKTPEQLQALLDTVRTLQQEENAETASKDKLSQLQRVLEMHGRFSGINRKVQLRRVGHTQNKFKVNAKWGGELTPAGMLQAEALGKHFRSLYPGEKSGNEETGFLRLHNTYRHDLKIFSSDEGRVQMTAAAFARGLLSMDAELGAMLVHMVKSADTEGLLDDDVEALRHKEVVRLRVARYFQQDREFSEQDMVELNPSRSEAMNETLKKIGNPRKHCEDTHQLAKKLCINIRKRSEAGNAPKLYLGESWELMHSRWETVVQGFRHVKDDGQVFYDTSKIHDLYDNVRYDLQHNTKYFREWDSEKLYARVKLLADVVILQEYGMERQEKLQIGVGTCTPLMRQLQADLRACVQQNEGEDTGVTNLDADASVGIRSPTRRVQTRLYFTHKSHLHSFMNVLRYGDLFGAEEEQWKRAESFLSEVWEYNFLSQVVIMLYENKAVPENSEQRFHAELHFSPGMSLVKSADQLEQLETTPVEHTSEERLIATDIIGERSIEKLVNPVLRSTAVVAEASEEPSLWGGGPKSRDLSCYVPPVCKLLTLSNRLSYNKLAEFLDRMTRDKKSVM